MIHDNNGVQQEFAERLKKLRTAANLTQGQLAEKLGVSRGSISFYENCDRVPDIVFLDTVSKFFGVDTSYMLGETENLNPKNSVIGPRLSLTDKAIDFLEGHEEFGEFLSSLIEDEKYFLSFYEYCFSFLAEREWRIYDECVLGCPVKKLADIDELEEFRCYKIVDLFVQLLKAEKQKRLLAILRRETEYKGLDDTQILEQIKAMDALNQQKLDKARELENLYVFNFTQTQEDLENESIRRAARAAAGYETGNEDLKTAPGAVNTESGKSKETE